LDGKVKIEFRDDFEMTPVDYTEWRKNNLCNGMTVEEISKEAMKVYNQENI
jgi:hypothetical protein